MNIRPVLLLLAFIGSSVSWAGTSPILLAPSPKSEPTTTYTKTLEKSYSVKAAGNLVLDNRYGSIDFNTWDKKEVRIVVRILVDASNETRAQETFDRISVDFSGTASLVAAKTTIEKCGNTSSTWSWSWSDFGPRSPSFRINYEVMAPKGFELDANNRYGDIKLANLSSKASINLQYGNLSAGRLVGNSSLELSYGEAVIGSTEVFTSKIRYGKLKLAGASSATIDSRYSDLKLGRFNTLNITSQYDDYTIQAVRSFTNVGNYNEFQVDSAWAIKLSGNYTDLKLGYLADLADLNLTYGDVVIRSTAGNVKHINFKGSYSDFWADLHSSLSFKLDAKTQYGSINLPSELATASNVSNGRSSQVLAEHGSGAKTLITLSSAYGDLTLK